MNIVNLVIQCAALLCIVCVCCCAMVPTTPRFANGCPVIDAPVNGLRIDSTNMVTFQCAKNYQLKGEMQSECLPNGTWTAEAPTCEHICKDVQCPVGMKCVVEANETASCACKINMDCTSSMNVVCGSDGNSYNNECIMKATGCRKHENITTVLNNRCVPGHRCSIVPKSSCRAAFPVFYYDTNIRRCMPMIAGGCHPSGWNGFYLKRECNRDCNNVCSEPRAVSGPCTKKLKRWYFDSAERQCKPFIYGGCFGSTNNFASEHDCQRRCLPKQATMKASKKVAKARRIKNGIVEKTTELTN